MSLAVWTSTWVPLHPYGSGDSRPTVVARMSGGGEQRASVLSRELRRYEMRFRVTTTVKQAIAAFFTARGQTLESFLFKDLKDYARTGVTPSPATGNGVATVFTLPLTGTYAGDYPIDDGNAILKAGGSPVTKTVQTDARTMTAAAAPGASAITMDYHYYRRVRLESAFAWSEPIYGVWEASFALVEVPST